MAGAQSSKGELPHSFAGERNTNGVRGARERVLSGWVDACCSIRSVVAGNSSYTFICPPPPSTAKSTALMIAVCLGGLARNHRSG